MAKKSVQIKCQGAGNLGINFLTPLQGGLKKISKENLEKLKTEIVTDGFSFPIAVWENPSDAQIYILDGHQRYSALLSLRDDGYKIPEIPIVFVQAESYEQAKHKLLAAASQYGKINEDGLMEFLKDVNFDIDELTKTIDLNIDFAMINFDKELSEIATFEPEPTKNEPKIVEVEGHSREISTDNKRYKLGDVWILGIHTIIYAKFASLDRILQVANTLGENLVIGSDDGINEADKKDKVCVIVNSNIDQVLSIIKKWEDRTGSKAEQRVETILRKKDL